MEKSRSVYKRLHSRRSFQEREKPRMVTLTKYIQMFLTNMNEKFLQKNLSIDAIIIHPMIALQIVILFWVVL